MNSAVDSATISHTQVGASRSRTVYFWIALALFGLATIGGAVASSHYSNIIDAPYVGP